MRVTTLGTSDSMLNYILSGESKYYDLSQQASSGLKVRRPSDDPFAAKSVLNINTQLSKLESYTKNMSECQNELDVVDGAMSSLTDLINNATNLTTQAVNGTYSDDDLANIKIQIDQIIQSVTDLGNTQYNGTYIFSGTSTDTKTYDVTKDLAGNITSITYQGTPTTDAYQRYTTIADGVSIPINTTGDQIFGEYDSGSGTATGLLGTLMTISNAIGLPVPDRTTANTCLDQLNSALDTVSVNRTTFASISNRFQITQSSIDTSTTQLTAYKSDLQDADLSVVLADLTTQKIALQSTYSITSQLLGKTSLLDYL